MITALFCYLVYPLYAFVYWAALLTPAVAALFIPIGLLVIGLVYVILEFFYKAFVLGA
jgi:hypothetical protein